MVFLRVWWRRRRLNKPKPPVIIIRGSMNALRMHILEVGAVDSTATCSSASRSTHNVDSGTTPTSFSASPSVRRSQPCRAASRSYPSRGPSFRSWRRRGPRASRRSWLVGMGRLSGAATSGR
ncbi:hypothetical protein Cni_G10478 [Canna indica]|uniref:Uncharacterized protein n=1 Tax=Canna indica TaxID=4628 RepID=A0AAQ3Q7C9_9LILI|nr:hypothetical protein Cni_G10478 [Canna indica]